MVGMRYFKQWVLFICLSVYCSASAQEVKKAMTFDEMVSWKRITEQKISHDGKWVACKMEPWRGDASIFVYNAKGEMTASFLPHRLNFLHFPVTCWLPGSRNLKK